MLPYLSVRDTPYTYLLPYMSVRQPLCLFSALLVCTGALVPICCPTCLYGSPYTHLLPYMSVRQPHYKFAALHVCTGVQVHKAEELRKVEQDARTLYVRFIKTFPSSHEEIKVSHHIKSGRVAETGLTVPNFNFQRP